MSAHESATASALTTRGRKRLGGVLSLARGTVLAQLVFVLATPILTRIYSAEDLGVFGIFAAVVLIASRLAGLRYELAIPLPQRDEVALNLVWLTALVTLAMLCVTGLAYAFVVYGLDLFAGAHPLQSYEFLVMAGVALFVFNESLVMWFIRLKEFGVVANARVTNSVLLALLQLAGWLSPLKLVVLLGAYPVALAVSVAYMLRRLDWTIARRRVNRPRLFGMLARRYSEFPIYTTLSTVTFEISQALPLFALSAFFGNAQVGYFFLARRVGLIPTSVIGRAISQVNYAEMLEHHRSGALADVLLKQLHLLQWISVVPAVVLAWFAPAICERLLGADWRVAGEYLQLMTPYVVVRLVFAPTLAINYVAKWQRQGFWVELGSTLLSTAALFWYAMHGSAYASVAGYFAVLGLANLVYRTYLMQRLGVGPLRVLWPALLQVAGLAGALALMFLS